MLYPHVEEGKFVLVMDLTRTNLNFKHLTAITNGTVQAAEPKKGTVQNVLNVNF